MFCSECGKTIDDEAVICPECGAVTKKGILKLQEAAKQGAEVKENQDFTTIKSKDDSKIMRLVAMIIGLVGSALLLSSLLGEFASTTAPIIGKYSISVSNYLDKLTILVVLLAGFSIVASLLKYSILQIVTGTLTGAWIGYSMWDIQSRASTSEISGMLDINFGIGTYLFICAACLMLASGIVYIVAERKAKANAPADEKPNPKPKKAEIIVSICLGVLVICGIGIFIFFRNYQGTKEVKATVGNFMNAAIHYEVDTMKSYLSSDVNDKNGFMEAYTPYTMRNAFLSIIKVDYSDLKEGQRKAIDRTGTLFGEHYLKKYDVVSANKNNDGNYIVKVKASIIDMSTTSEQIQKGSAEKVAEYAKKYPEIVETIRSSFSEEEAAEFMAYLIFDDICPVIDNAIRNAGSMETEFTFVVKKIDGSYKITEIDYKDE